MANSVLVVDGSAITREICARQLESLGVSVEVVASLSKAVTCACRHDYDFILMGSCGHIDQGAQATRLLRLAEQARGRYTPIIGLADDRERQSFLDAGMDDCVPRPVSMTALRQVVQRWISYMSGKAEH